MNKINPFFEKATPITESYEDWSKLNSKPYDKSTASPYTKTRVILMNGTEFEANWFLHNFSRHCPNNELRRELAKVRRREQQQQKIVSALKPLNESNLETTIGYEQLAVDLTAMLAKRVSDTNVKAALDFALLEDFDHLYRYSNLLLREQGIKAEGLVNQYTEITPGRPTISEHRFPSDDIKNYINSAEADLMTKLTVNIITAAEQQTMNYYMNVATLHQTEEGRKLYTEIAMIEEQHVSQYGSLIDTTHTWLECWVMHEYTEAYLYYSCFATEIDKRIKQLWYDLYLDECGHLQKAAELLKRYENTDWRSLFPDGGEFPEPLSLESNIAYVREVLDKTVYFTAKGEGYSRVSDLDKDDEFFKYNHQVNKSVTNVESHNVIANTIKQCGKDYRFEIEKNPVSVLQDRTSDNTTLARVIETHD